MAQAYCATRISPHMAKTAEGFLICLGAPVCRSGYQTYRVSEVDPTMNDDSEIDIYRPVGEVTSPSAVASIEGCSITRNHPARFLDPENHSWAAGGGHAQNARVSPARDKDGN